MTQELTRLPDLPYFIIILNTARDQRPRQEAKTPGSGKYPLQENLIDKGMIIAEFDDFLLCPNGYPYHRYASLLIARNPCRAHGYPTPAEIDTWMRFSILTKQFVFFNSPRAGASIPTRMHAQVVDPAGIRFEDKEITYPLINEKIVTRRSVRKGIDVLEGYGIEALVFRGRDAPHHASLAVKKLRDEQGHWYNLMIKEKEVFVVPRNAEKETSHCIGKKVGAYEMSGVILVGNIEEPLLEKLDLDRVVSGAEIFSQLNYEQIPPISLTRRRAWEGSNKSSDPNITPLLASNWLAAEFASITSGSLRYHQSRDCFSRKILSSGWTAHTRRSSVSVVVHSRLRAPNAEFSSSRSDPCPFCLIPPDRFTLACLELGFFKKKSWPQADAEKKKLLQADRLAESWRICSRPLPTHPGSTTVLA